MMSFAQALQDTEQVVQTANGMDTLSSSMNSNVDLFFAIGSSRGKDITGMFSRAYAEHRETALRMLLWARDARGGAGERQATRNLLRHLEANHPQDAKLFVPVLSEYGRWDDLLVFTGAVQTTAFDHIRDTLLAGAASDAEGAAVSNARLCAKWMPRKGKTANALRKHMGLSPRAYRRLVVDLTNVVETQMCAGDWKNINYSHVPSVAAARYQKAFGKHDPQGYEAYRDGLKSGTTKINAAAVYPYDVIKSLNKGDKDVAEAQWAALPNWLSEDQMILPMVDTSGSMGCGVNGSYERGVLSCLDVALSLGLYLADKQTGPLSNTIMTFSERPTLQVLSGDLRDKYNQLQRADWGMNTNLEAARNRILQVATQNKLTPAEMPKWLLILSDMEFDRAARGGTAQAGIEKSYSAAGYDMPNVVWWNLNAREGNNPVRFDKSGAALISGFSPSIMKSILAAKQVTPQAIMVEALYGPRYDGVIY